MSKNYPKYIYITIPSISIGFIIGAVLTGLGFFLDARGALVGGDTLDTIGLSVGIVAFAVTLCINAYSNRKNLTKAFGVTDKGKGLLDEAVSACLDAANRYDENDKICITESKIRKDKYKGYLQEIIEADRIYPIELKFDSTASADDLFKVSSTMSITEAPILAWKAPEYQWFLLNHYVSTLLRRLKNGNITIYDRYASPHSTEFSSAFKTFSEHTIEVLKSVKEKGYSPGDSVRFYLIDRKKILEFKDMLMQFVAGHELFGVYVFFIDDSILNYSPGQANLKEKMILLKQGLYHTEYGETIDSNIDTSKDVLDLMIVGDSVDDLVYKYSKEGKLTKMDNRSSNKSKINDFIKCIAGKLLDDWGKDPHSWLIYPSAKTNTYTNDCLGENAVNTIYSIMDEKKENVNRYVLNSQIWIVIFNMVASSTQARTMDVIVMTVFVKVIKEFIDFFSI